MTYQVYVLRLGIGGGSDRRRSSVVSLERAGPGVGGGVVLPLAVAVGLALKLLLTDILVGVVGVDLHGDGSGKDGKDELHFLIL
tara:strand:- start:72 stop:323 length:252 start_codon:yes stop_codon:yes gene_type:complete